MPPKPNREIAGEWECMECGYVERGFGSRRPVECRECGASPRALEFFPGDPWDEEDDEDDTDVLDDEIDEHYER